MTRMSVPDKNLMTTQKEALSRELDKTRLGERLRLDPEDGQPIFARVKGSVLRILLHGDASRCDPE